LGGVAGTPTYMPPEFYRQGATVDARADIYLLGNLLLELMTFDPFGEAVPEREQGLLRVAGHVRQLPQNRIHRRRQLEGKLAARGEPAEDEIEDRLRARAERADDGAARAGEVGQDRRAVEVHDEDRRDGASDLEHAVALAGREREARRLSRAGLSP